MSPGARKIALRIATALLALTFISTGLGKLLNVQPSPDNFARWGLSMTFMHVVGVVEVTCGIGLLFPRIAQLTAFVLMATMLGALRTGVMFGEALHIVVPAVLLILLALVVRELRASAFD